MKGFDLLKANCLDTKRSPEGDEGENENEEEGKRKTTTKESKTTEMRRMKKTNQRLVESFRNPLHLHSFGIPLLERVD